MISRIDSDEPGSDVANGAPGRAASESPFAGWPGADALDALPEAAQDALISLKTDVSALRAVVKALPLRIKRVAQIKLMRKKASARRLATMGVALAFAGVVACILVAFGAAMVLFGLSSALAAALGLPLWAGVGIAGTLLLTGLALAASMAWRRHVSARMAAVTRALDDLGLSHFRAPGPPSA